MRGPTRQYTALMSSIHYRACVVVICSGADGVLQGDCGGAVCAAKCRGSRAGTQRRHSAPARPQRKAGRRRAWHTLHEANQHNAAINSTYKFYTLLGVCCCYVQRSGWRAAGRLRGRGVCGQMPRQPCWHSAPALSAGAATAQGGQAPSMAHAACSKPTQRRDKQHL